MKKIVIISLLTFFSIFGKAQLLAAEKIAIQLDSIAKAEKITKFSVYYHAYTNGGLKEFFIDYFTDFKFNGQLLLLIDPDNVSRYYNLNKLVHFTINKKDHILKLYFQVS